MKIIQFLNQIKEYWQNITNEEFKKGINSLLSYKRTPDINLIEVQTSNFTEICNHEYMFDRREREIEILEKMIEDDQIETTKQEVIQQFENMFFNNVKQINLEMVSKKHKVMQETDFEETSKQFTIKRSPIKLTDHKAEGVDELSITTASTLWAAIQEITNEPANYFSDIYLKRWRDKLNSLEAEGHHQPMDVDTH